MTSLRGRVHNGGAWKAITRGMATSASSSKELTTES